MPETGRFTRFTSTEKPFNAYEQCDFIHTSFLHQCDWRLKTFLLLAPLLHVLHLVICKHYTYTALLHESCCNPNIIYRTHLYREITGESLYRQLTHTTMDVRNSPFKLLFEEKWSVALPLYSIVSDSSRHTILSWHKAIHSLLLSYKHNVLRLIIKGIMHFNKTKSSRHDLEIRLRGTENSYRV